MHTTIRTVTIVTTFFAFVQVKMKEVSWWYAHTGMIGLYCYCDKCDVCAYQVNEDSYLGMHNKYIYEYEHENTYIYS